MFFVYIIESMSTGRWYVGSTNDIQKRLDEHNAGKTKSTKVYRPYKIVYTEEYQTKTEALKREKQIKRSGIIRKQLKKEFANKAPSSSG